MLRAGLIFTINTNETGVFIALLGLNRQSQERASVAYAMRASLLFC
jgi:hypothetical protein